MSQAQIAPAAAGSAPSAEIKSFAPQPDAEAGTPPATGAASGRRRGGPKRLILGAVIAAILAAGGYEGYRYWTVGRFMVSTDDAYLQADITAIAPRVQGYVKSIAVSENQAVKAGDLLLTLEDSDYRNALATAQTQVATQEATIRRITAQVTAAEAAVDQARAQKAAAEAALTNAKSHLERVRALTKSSVAAQAQLDDASMAHDQAIAAVTGADAQIEAARANVAVLQAQLAEAKSQLATLRVAVEQARRDLDRTVLRAPVAGTVGNLAVRVGDLVSPGQKLAAVVPVNGIYVEANYKETQLGGIAPGASAQVTIDTLPGRTFEGRVASIAPATGAQFSLLPPENATGNFTKVVQRVPVRISLPPEAYQTGALRAGLSAVVDVDSRTSPRHLAAAE